MEIEKKQKRSKKLLVGLSPLAVLTLSACSSGPKDVSGTVVKGPLENAKVFLDLDGDGIQDANESSVRTSSDGSYTISTKAKDYTVVAVTDESTIDTSSGTVLSGVTLSASKGASVVTPMTTLMNEGNLTVEQVAEVLDLPDGVDPLSFNPYAAGVDATTALAVEKTSQMVMSAIQTVSASLQGAGATVDESFDAALDAVIDAVTTTAASTTTTTLDFTDTTELQSIMTDAISTASTNGNITTEQATIATSKVTDTAAAIASVNTKIDAITDTDLSASANTFSVSQVVAEQVSEAVANDTTISVDVDAIAANSAPSDITLTSSSISEAATSLVVGTLGTTDADHADGDTYTYKIAQVADTDYAAFSIDGTTLSLVKQPDYETKDEYSVVIITTDSGGKSFSETITVSVTDAADVFKLDSATVTTQHGALDAQTLTLTNTDGTLTTSEALKLDYDVLQAIADGGNVVEPDVSLDLSSMPSGSGSGTIGLTIIDGNDTTRDAGERLAKLEIDVNWEATVSEATIELPAQTASGYYITDSQGTVNFEINNLDSDTITITQADDLELPSTLEVKIAELLDQLPDTNLEVGTYTAQIDISGIPLVDVDGGAIDTIQTVIEIV